MPTAYSRVTVVNDARRVDLALPSALPLTDVMPQLLGFCAPDGSPECPVGWTLGRVGGANISLASTLADAGVTDGDVLELRAGKEAIHPAYVEDVRDVLEDAVDESARQWQSRTTVAFALVTGAIVLAAAVLLPRTLHPAAVAPLVVAAVVAAWLVVVAWWAADHGHTTPAQVVVAVAALWGGVAGWLAATFVDWPLAAGAAGALTGALLVTAAARAMTTVATAHLAALALMSAAGVAAGAAEMVDLDPLTGVRLAAVGTVLVVGVLPRASLTVGGLAGADYLVRNQGLISEDALAARIRESTALLHGGILGATAVGVGTGVPLALTASIWDHLLGVTVGLALVLRSRAFSRVPQVVPLRVAGLVVVVAHAVRWIQDTPPLQPWAVPLAAAAVGIGVALSAVPLSDVARARAKQLLNRAEIVVVVVMIPLAAAALGLFDLVAEILPG